MLSQRRQQENTFPAQTKIVKVTPQAMQALFKANQMKGLIPATLETNDAGQQIFRPVLGTLNYWYQL